MAISINWGTKVITVLKTDMTMISATLYELDVNIFRLVLKDLEDDEAGMPFLRTHNHNTTVTVGGATLARVVEIINGYTITFEDGQYAVRLVGANNNIADVMNLNQVSLRTANTAGLIQLGAAPSVAQIVAGIKMETYDGVAYDQIIADLLASISGKMAQLAEGKFAYKARDGVTTRFELEDTGNGRLRS